MSATTTTKRSVLFILADGARVDVLRQLLGQSKLPHIAELAERGGFFEATTCFPSVTGPAYLPYLTGLFPGTANIPGIRWFDREKYSKWWMPSLTKYRSYVGPGSSFVGRDLAKDAVTLYEQDDRNVNIINCFTRGCSSKNDLMNHSRMWHMFRAHQTNDWYRLDQTTLAELQKRISSHLENGDGLPPFIFWPYLAIDEFSHRTSPFSSQVLASYEKLDAAVGELMEQFKTAPHPVDFVIAADHGLTETHTHLDLVDLMKEEGYRPFYHPLIHRKFVDSAIMVSGNAMAHLYLKSRERGWFIRTPHEYVMSHHQKLHERLLREEAVDLIVTHAACGRKHVINRDGHCWFRVMPSGIVDYEVVSGVDPLGLNLPAKKVHVNDTFAMSLETNVPDGLVQLNQLFRSNRTGDIIVTARKGFDLRDRFETPEHHASHGSLHREHMMVPVVTTLPLRSTAFRSVDLYATLCEVLGYPLPKLVDGVSQLGVVAASQEHSRPASNMLKSF